MLQLTNTKETLKFIAFLEEALPFIDYLTPTSINNGGCGIFAMALHTTLKNYGIESKIYALYLTKDQDRARKDLINFIHTNKREDIGMAGAEHIVVRVGDLFLDSTGVVNTAYLASDLALELTDEQVELLIDYGRWNPTFDRTTVDFIKSNLNEVFSNYDSYELGCLLNKKTLSKEVEYTNYTKRKMKEQRSNSLFNYLLDHV